MEFKPVGNMPPYIPFASPLTEQIGPEDSLTGRVTHWEITAPGNEPSPPPGEWQSPLIEVRNPGEHAGYFIAAHTIERPYNVRHYPNLGRDVVVNTTHPDQALVGVAANYADADIANEWVAMSVGRRAAPRYINSLTNPTLFAQRRPDASTEAYRAHREQDAALPPGEAAEYRRADQANHSVLNEIVIAKRVREILAAELNEPIIAAGYSGLEVIEPLLAISNHADGAKTVLYPYLNASNGNELGGRLGASLHRSHDAQRHETNIHNLALAIESILLENGIRPYELSSSQILIGYDEHGGNADPLPLMLTGIAHYTQNNRRIPRTGTIQISPPPERGRWHHRKP